MKFKPFMGTIALVSMIYKWHGLFKHGRESIEDDPRSGRPVEATTSDIIEKVEKLVLEDARLKKK